MSRHIVDRRKPSEGGRLKHYVEVEKTHGEDGSHPAARALHARPVKRDEAAKLRAYFRIERGQSA